MTKVGLEKLFLQFEEVRASGLCNMFDRNAVGVVADSRNLHDLVCATADRKEYAQLLQDFSEWKRGQEE